MKKGFTFLLMFILLLNIFFVSAEACNLDVSMINQDPYPATPGDYVDVVFQVSGVSNPDCGKINFKLLEKYPLAFDPGAPSSRTIDSGIYERDFNPYFLASYKVRVDENALDGDNPIDVVFGHDLGSEIKQFNLNVKNVKADFEIFIKSYDPKTKEMTFEILNIAESDVEALTLEIPRQDNIVIKGPNTNIAGDLDSNEFTTADFEALPKRGEIMIKISYSDVNNVRRNIEKIVFFEPDYFENRFSDEKETPVITYVIVFAIIVFIIWYLRKRAKKKKADSKRHQS